MPSKNFKTILLFNFKKFDIQNDTNSWMCYLFVFIVTLNNIIFYSDFILLQYLFP